MDKLTIKELKEIFYNQNTNWKGDNAFQGLQILSKYTANLICAAEHDIIYSDDIYTVLNAGLTTEDAEKLRELNWIIEEDHFACYV